MHGTGRGGTRPARRARAHDAGGRRRVAAVAVLTLLAAFVVPLAPVVPVPDAAAVELPSGIRTGFQIDGDKTGGSPPGTMDWNDVLRPPATTTDTGTLPSFVPTAPYTTESGEQSSGIFAGAFYWDGDFSNCASGDEPTGNALGGSQNQNTNPWVAAPTNIGPGAGDLCSAGYAAEALTGDGGQRTFILYGYFTRRTGGNATSDVSTLFEGPEPGRCDDLLLDAHFPLSERVFYEWVPAAGDGCANPDGAGEWAATTRPVDFVIGAGQRTEGPPVGNQQENTFGEYAMNLTASDLFSDGDCSSYTVSTVMTRSSTSFTSNIIDFLEPTGDPLEISNCGTLTVTKETPVGETDDEFGFSVTNDSSGGVVVPPEPGPLTGSVRSGETETFENVLGSSQLHLTETDVPEPWELTRAECTYTDQAGEEHVVDVSEPGTPFTLLPDGRTDCVLTNDAALVTVTKQTRPEGSGQRFGFDVGGREATLGDGQSETFAVPAGDDLTLTEEVVDGWMPPEVECTDGTDTAGGSVTVTPVLGQSLECTFTNTQLATVTIEKSTPVDSAGSFDFSWDGGEFDPFTLTTVPADGATVAVDSQEFEVPPGEYSVTEDVPDDYDLTTLTCVDPPYGTEDELPVDPPTAEFTVRPGSQMTCTFVDVRRPTLATLRVEKATTPMVAWDQDFPFSVTGPEGFEEATFDVNTAGTWRWAAEEVPPGEYTITEEQLPGWAVDSVACTRPDGSSVAPDVVDGTATLTLVPEDIVTCRYTNRAEPAGLTATKTVAGVAESFDWSFDVSLSPAPGTSTTVDGTGPGSDSASWGELHPGQRYVLREAARPGWDMGAITCTDGDGGVADLDDDDLTFTFDAEVAQQLECAMTNTAQPSSVSMRKVSTGLSADYDWSFDVQISPLPAGATNPTTVSGTGQSAVTASWGNLVPGQSYDLTEIDLPDEVTQRLDTCTGAEVVQIPDGFRFTAPLAGEVSCTLTNFVAAVPATLTKTSTGGDGRFVFTLAELDGNAPAVDVPVVTSGGTGSATFDLVPGQRYALNEADQAGWIEEEIVCTRTPAGGGDPVDLDVTGFVVQVGDTVGCAASNSLAPGSVTFTKTVAGVTGDYDWSFPMTLTPAGEDPLEQDVAGAGPGSSSVAWTDLDPGTYTLEEGGTQGWDTGPITCGLDETGDEDPFTPGFQIVLEAGESYSCEASNTAQPATVTIAKSTAGIGDGLEWSFDFTLSPAPDGQESTVPLTGTGPGAGDDPHTWTDLSPGAVYSLTEADPGLRWTTSGVVCDDGSGTTIDGARIVAAPGAEYACEAVNTAPAVTGSITKTAVGGDAEFEFLLDTVPSSGDPTTVPVATTDGTGTADLPTLLPGNRYSLTEQPADGWRPTGALACTRTPAGGGDATPIPDLADFAVQAGDRVDCTAENTANGRVILYKEVHGTGDQSRDFDFSSNIDGHEEFTVSGVVDDGTLTETVIEDVAPGEDYFFEEATDGGDPETLLADLSCTYGGDDHSGTPEDRENRRIGFEVLPGQTTECYFTNAVEGTLILIKRSVPANYDQDFDFTITGPSVAEEDQDFTINSDPSVDGAIRSWSGLVGGTYTLTEGQMPEGWSLDTQDGATFCNTADGWTLDPDAQSITVELDAADVVTCFFSNRAERAEVSVTKSAEGLAAGTPWSFPVTLSPADGVTPGGTQTVEGTAPDSAVVSWQNLTPGVTYTLREPAADGWTAAELQCAGATDASPAAGFQFVAGVGQSLECTLVNTAAAASVEATKTVSGVAPGLDWSFELALTPDATPAGPQDVTGTGSTTSAPVTWTELVPGTRYTLAETSQTGWVQGQVRCAGLADESADAGFQFTATPGMALQCGVSNAGTASRVSVAKTTTGVADDVAWSFPVTISPTSAPRATQNLTGTGSSTSEAATWTALVPGVTYTLTEDRPVGWTGGEFACDVGGTPLEDADDAEGFQLVAGLDQAVSCVVTNAAEPAEVSVTKTVSGVDDDLAWSFGVSLSPGATPDGALPLSGTGNTTSEPGAFTELVPGTVYTLTEDVPSGWTSPGFVCDVDDLDPDAAGFQFRAALGQSVSCDVANAADPAALSVVKTVAGVADGLAWSFPVTLDPPAGGVGTQDATGTGNASGEPLEWSGLVPGRSYDLSEAADGYDAGEVTCDVDGEPVDLGMPFTPAAGDDISCAVTNTARPVGLSVTKSVIGAPDAEEWSFPVTLTPPGDPEGTRALTGTGDETSEPATWDGLVPGATYTLTEDDVPIGWTAGAFVCAAGGDPLEDASDDAGFQLVPVSGQDVACDVVNSPDPATGTITKTAVGGDGDFGFLLTPEGQPGQELAVTTDGGTGSVDLPPLLPGVTYALAEQPTDGWAATGELACTTTPAGGGEATPVEDLGAFTVEAGASLDCTATNTRLGRIVVVKAVDGADAEFGFTGSWLDPQDFTIETSGGTGARTFDDVAPGEHTLTEVAREGYEGTELVCADGVEDGAASTVDGLEATIGLDPGEIVTCTFSNTAWGVLVVDKTTVPASDQEFGFVWGPVDGERERFMLADADEPFVTAPLEPGAYTVAEDGADGWQLAELACTGSSGDTAVDGAAATVDVRAGDTVLCRFINARSAALTVEKTVVSGPVDRGSGTFELGYRVVVANPGGVAARYDLDDRLRFGAGIEVASASVASPDVRVNPGWDGVGDTTVAAGATIAAGATQSFDVVVTARVPATVLDAARVCQGAVGQAGGSGFLNTAALSSPDGADVSADACVDVPPAAPGPGPSPSPSAPPAAGPGGPLPVTGLGAGIAGLALALLLGGVALVLVRRRRG